MRKVALLALLLPVLSGAPQRPKILGVAHIAFYVSDLDKTRAFWTDFLGYQECFNLNRETDNTVRIAFIKINDYQYVELFAEKPRAGQMLNHISLYTDNAEAMRDYLAAKGVKVPAEASKGRTGNKNYNITDPDGNIIEMVEYQPDSWTARDKGMFLPATRISNHIAHVGVSVRAIEPAMDFYHGILGFNEFWRGTRGPLLSWINMRVPDGQDYVEFMLYDTLPPPEKRGSRNHLSLTVPDALKAIEILKARPAFKNYGRELKVQIGVNQKRQVNIYDPDGSRVELMEPNTITGKPAPSSMAPPPRMK
ncbi:MAG TPA: VOC family protein [Bryobacteraceae bacterium]|jgi:lactoylglutathione lyase